MCSTFGPYIAWNGLEGEKINPPKAASIDIMIIVANSLDPDTDLTLDPNCLKLWWYSWKVFFSKVDFEKNANNQKACKIIQLAKELIGYATMYTANEAELSNLAVQFSNLKIMPYQFGDGSKDTWSEWVD